MSSEQLAEFKQFGDRVSRDTSYMTAISTDSREGRDMASRLASTTARSERAEASLAERTTYAERMSAAYERGETIAIDIAQDPHNLEMFTRYAEQYGSDSTAAHALMASELARQSLRPNRVLSDGTALPMSFGDLRVQHAHELGDKALAPDVTAHHRLYSRRVSRFGNTAPTAAPDPAPSSTRDEVQTRAAEIRSRAESSSVNFDSNAEIVKTDNGTLATRKSLLKQSGKQVAKDAGASVDNVKDAVKGLLKK